MAAEIGIGGYTRSFGTWQKIIGIVASDEQESLYFILGKYQFLKVRFKAKFSVNNAEHGLMNINR